MQQNKIICPNCQHEFDVESMIASKLETRFKIEFETKMAVHKKQMTAVQKKLDAEREALESAQAEYETRLKAETKKALKIQLTQAEKTIKASMQEDFETQLNALKSENESRKAENKVLKEKEIELLVRESKLNEAQELLQLKIDKEILQRQKEIEEKATIKAQKTFELERLRYQKQIEDSKKLAEEMKRKAEQGSMQLQGEVQEIALENMLASAYPFDLIEPVAKGIRGADCLQQVRNASQNICGTIVYESKRTKNFANDWLEKLKNDQVACKADLAVLVTQTLPNDINQFGECDGVWICDFHSAKALSFVLRDMLIRTYAVRQSQENKGEKMELLYNYLTSNEFVQHVQRIVENYDNMHKQINDERKAMERLWKKREKQIEVVQQNLSQMFGSIEGYTGDALEKSGILELPEIEPQI